MYPWSKLSLTLMRGSILSSIHPLPHPSYFIICSGLLFPKLTWAWTIRESIRRERTWPFHFNNAFLLLTEASPPVTINNNGNRSSPRSIHSCEKIFFKAHTHFQISQYSLSSRMNNIQHSFLFLYQRERDYSWVEVQVRGVNLTDIINTLVLIRKIDWLPSTILICNLQLTILIFVLV